MRILTVFTGGTIGSSLSKGAISPNTVAPYTVLSENLSAEYLEKLRSCVEDNLNSGYDGIVVTHGTDTLQYSAAYLDLTLGLIETPVVLVSSNYPLPYSRANGLENFAAAVDFIRSKQGRGVFVSYLNRGGASSPERKAERQSHFPAPVCRHDVP